MIPTIEQAEEIVKRYNEEEFHLLHARTVSGVMRELAARYAPGEEDYWAVVGMLHDVDFEQFPEEHCVRGEALLRAEDVDESVIRAAMSHGFGGTGTPHAPERLMEKVLFAVDELTGLIWAAALMRPSKSTADMELSSVKKKFKDKKFAAGCSRDIIRKGAEQLGWELDRLLEETLSAMRAVEAAQKS